MIFYEKAVEKRALEFSELSREVRNFLQAGFPISSNSRTTTILKKMPIEGIYPLYVYLVLNWRAGNQEGSRSFEKQSNSVRWAIQTAPWLPYIVNKSIA